jgi:hypothetical protein
VSIQLVLLFIIGSLTKYKMFRSVVIARWIFKYLNNNKEYRGKKINIYHVNKKKEKKYKCN